MSLRCTLPIVCLFLVVSNAFAEQAAPRVKMQTTAGDIVIELDPGKAPATVANFLAYVDKGFYDGLIFHRVIPGFMAQGGGFDTRFVIKEPDEPVTNESRNGLSNLRGTIAMARTAAPHSATSQFFINLADNRRLDAGEYRWGYTVFGKVIEGMNVVDGIAEIPTGPAGPFRQDVPQFMVTIKRMSRLAPVNSKQVPENKTPAPASDPAGRRIDEPT